MAGCPRANGVDLGPVPVDVTRPAWTHRVVVKKDGPATYPTQRSVRVRQETELRVRLELVR